MYVMSPISIPASYILILHIFHNDKKLALLLLLLLLLLRFFVLYDVYTVRYDTAAVCSCTAVQTRLFVFILVLSHFFIVVVSVYYSSFYSLYIPLIMFFNVFVIKHNFLSVLFVLSFCLCLRTTHYYMFSSVSLLSVLVSLHFHRIFILSFVRYLSFLFLHYLCFFFV